MRTANTRILLYADTHEYVNKGVYSAKLAEYQVITGYG